MYCSLLLSRKKKNNYIEILYYKAVILVFMFIEVAEKKTVCSSAQIQPRSSETSCFRFLSIPPARVGGIVRLVTASLRGATGRWSGSKGLEGEALQQCGSRARTQQQGDQPQQVSERDAQLAAARQQVPERTAAWKERGEERGERKRERRMLDETHSPRLGCICLDEASGHEWNPMRVSRLVEPVLRGASTVQMLTC